jgi:hypothetical protein
MITVIPPNTATAALRRISFTLVDATDFVTPEDISVTGVKATLSIAGGTPANSTNDIVKVSGTVGEYYLELTQAESNQTAGTVVRGWLTPSGCALAKIQARIDETVASRSTYAGSDTSGTTTLLGRLTSDRAGYLDKLNVSGNLAHTDNAASFQANVSGLAEKTDLPTNFAALGINGSGHVSRVVLVDTTTTNSDMRGTDGAYTGTPPSAGDIAVAVRDVNNSSPAADSLGASVNSAASAGDPWTTALPGSYSAGTAGYIIGNSAGGGGYGGLYDRLIMANLLETGLVTAGLTYRVVDPGGVDLIAATQDGLTEYGTSRIYGATVEDWDGSWAGTILWELDGDLLGSETFTPIGGGPDAADVADAVIGRSVSHSEATAAEHSLATLILAHTESSTTVDPGKLTIYRTDGTTVHVAKPLATSPASSSDVVTGIS